MRTDDAKFHAEQFERLYRMHPEMHPEMGEYSRHVSRNPGFGKEQPRREYSNLLLGGLAATVALAACYYLSPPVQSYYSSLSAIYNPQAYPWAGLDPHVPDQVEQIHARLQEGTVNVSKSTVTGIVDAATMTSSLYWTVVLKNNNSVDKEASFTIDLPKNSTVSRATLWVNGVAQEAAFASNEQVKEAYDRIVVRHRDPLLVTQVAPNRIKVLASPVTANGGEMKLRLGFTAPLRSDDNGHNTVTLPKIAESNLKFDCPQDVHLQSNTPISGLGSTEEAGVYILKANVDTGALANAEIKVGEPPVREFAARLTHTFPSQYVVGKFEDGRLVLRKESKRPDCKFFSSDDVAFRLSNLWAHQEIERTALSGDLPRAYDLANTYRVVSSVSGATVLEMESDYSASALNRNMYRVMSSGSQTSGDAFSSAPQLQGATNGTIGPAGSNSVQNFTAVQQLQGATVGGIGPQGSDATVIQGVNSAGTVRVNNLANLEAVLNIIANLAELLGIALAVVFGLRVMRRPESGRLAKAKGMLLTGGLCIVAYHIPTVLNLAIATARDWNLFS